MRSFLTSFSAVRKVWTFLRWSPWSWITWPSSGSSTTVPLQQNSVGGVLVLGAGEGRDELGLQDGRAVGWR